MKQLRSSANRSRMANISSEDLTANPVGSRVKGLELDLRLREFEISQLTQRNNFFMIFQGVLIGGLVQSQGTSAPIITFGMSLLGVMASVLQIGMAGGAKYWQSRWEASTRSSEIAIVLELLKQHKLAVQTFTHNSNVLTSDEKEQIDAWNKKQLNSSEKIVDDSCFIDEIVKRDIEAGSRRGFSRKLRYFADYWVRKLAIEPKWSVSRIPIWIGGILLTFWFWIALHTIHIPGMNFEAPDWWPIMLVPLK